MASSLPRRRIGSVTGRAASWDGGGLPEPGPTTDTGRLPIFNDLAWYARSSPRTSTAFTSLPEPGTFSSCTATLRWPGAWTVARPYTCLLYTSDAADEEDSV